MIQSTEPKKVLVLDSQSDPYWLEILRGAVSALRGAIEVVSATDAQRMRWRDYDLIILDAGVFSDLLSIIAWILSQDPEARIVVFSPAPSWKQAREVMLAGATDYARKSLHTEHILSTLKKNWTRQTHEENYPIHG